MSDPLIKSPIDNDDILVNLKTIDKVTQRSIRLIPRTKAEAVIESKEQQFISKDLKNSIYNKQDKLGYVPLNKAGDSMSGALFLNYAIEEDNHAATKKYVDDKTKNSVGSSSAFSKAIRSANFAYDNTTKLYKYEVVVTNNDKKIGIVQVDELKNNIYSEINVDISVDNNNSKIIIESVTAFDGRVTYSFIA